MRVGIVALIGRTNVGKSTLLNALAGESLSITAPSPQTTRDRIPAVLTRPDAQLVLVDAPGIHKAERALGEYMNAQAHAAAADADVVVMVTDVTGRHPTPPRDEPVLEVARACGKPVLLALNKVDRLASRSLLLPVLSAYDAAFPFKALIPVSAARKDGLDVLVDACVPLLPEGPMLHPEDTLTDRTMRFLAAEKIREAVIHETAQELPYATAVEIDKFDESGRLVHIAASIHVERQGQKAIVVGTGGQRIREIGTRARVAIEALVGRQVHLELWVKVTPGWTRTPAALARLGYSSASQGPR